MTDDRTPDELVPDPALAAALHRWAAATDPASDLVGGPAVRARAAGGVDRRLLLAAAVFLVALVAVATVWAVGRDPDTGRVTTDPAPTTSPADEDGVIPMEVVFDTTGRDPRLPNASYSVTIARDCGEGASCVLVPGGERRAVLAGTSSILATEVPAGRRMVARVDIWACGAPSCPRDVDGSSLTDDAIAGPQCEVPFEAASLVVIELVGDRPLPDCRADTGRRSSPPLTVPPAFSRRQVLPWSCGAATWPSISVDGTTDLDPDAAATAWDCLNAALAGGETVELPVLREVADGVRQMSWWRTGRGEVEVIRAPPTPTGGRWTRQVCRGLEPSYLEGIGGVDCTEPSEMVLPRLAPSVDSGGTSTGGGLDLAVSLLDGPAAVDVTTLDRWVLTAQGEELASGPLEAASTLMAADGLVADGVVTVRWARVTCDGPCPVAGPDGTPLTGTHRVTTMCEELVPSDLTRATVTFQSVDGAPGGATCPVAGVDELPPLTVPPAWSLRDPYPADCPDLGCVADRLATGDPVEHGIAHGGDGGVLQPVFLRVEGPGDLVVVRPAVGEGARWTRQVCTGLDATAGPTGCTVEEPIGLDPP